MGREWTIFKDTEVNCRAGSRSRKVSRVRGGEDVIAVSITEIVDGSAKRVVTGVP